MLSRSERAEKAEALCQRFLDGEFSEEVLNASLKCLGLYADEIHEAVWDTQEQALCLRKQMPKQATS